MNLKSFAAAAMATMMTLASCSSDEPVGGDQSQLFKGDNTYTAFAISMANRSSRAVTTDENADEVEQAIQSIRIYIFSGGVLEVKANPTISDYVTNPVQVTTGEKLIYAVTSETIGQSLDSKMTVATSTVQDFEKELFTSLSSDIANSGNFTMIGSSRATVLKWNEAQAKENAIGVEVERAAAKVQVKYTTEGTGAVNISEHLNATFGDAYFTIGQSARRMYVNLDSRYTELGDKDSNTGTFKGLVPVPSTGDLGFIEAPAAYDKKFDKNKYTAECVVETPTTGNVTFAIVRVKATPTNIYNDKNLPADGSFWTLARHDASTATWVFASDEGYHILYFDSESDANNYKTSNNLESAYTATKYDGGLSYYRVNIKTNPDSEDMSQKYRVLRNYCYHINVTDIKGLGAPTAPGVVPTDPDTPIEQDNFMVAEIDIKPWTVTEQNESLQ